MNKKINSYDQNGNARYKKEDQVNLYKRIEIAIASPERILKWSNGEVTKPETINYKTHKSEKNGLFDERIFGTTKDYRCPVCGKKHKRSDAGKKCTSCGEAIIESKLVRRRRMGHIKLATPIAHIWFSKIDYSVIRSIIGLKQDELDSIIYFKAHIIYDNGGFFSIKEREIIQIQDAGSKYRKILTILRNNAKNKELLKKVDEKILQLEKEAASDIGQNYGLDFYEYNNFIASHSNIRIGTGAETLKKILEKIDLRKELRKIKKIALKNPEQNSNFRRIKVIESFLKSGQHPGSMIIDVLPVIPVDLRPLIQLDGGRHSTVDVNELYRRVIIRNNRLKQWLLIGAPDLIVQNEKRMLQESVDALLDNARKKNPVNSKDNRPLKSLSENLKGKQGRFRQNLLGKRVDYSGRSVIVVGPELKLHQVGLPKQMVVKLFEPFIVNLLVQEGVAKSIKIAKKMIELYDDRIWKYASRVIKNHPVLLNRAPTLHRLSIQAFEPIITSGKAIRLHPLVTPSFNADFDGDQMAVHVPLSWQAKKEASELMIANKNILGPKNGKLILSPSEDIVLGMYYLTKSNLNQIGSKHVYYSYKDITNLLLLDKIHVHSVIAFPLTLIKDKFTEKTFKEYKYIVTTAGRALINYILPTNFPYFNDLNSLEDRDNISYLVKSIDKLPENFEKIATKFKPFKKSTLSKLIEDIYEFDNKKIELILDAIKELGFRYSMLSGASIGLNDIIDIPRREEILKHGDKEVNILSNNYNEGLITEEQRYKKVIEVWAKVKNEIEILLEEELKKDKDNPLYMMMDSGARGSISNFVQLGGMRGSMSKAAHEYVALQKQGIIIKDTEEIPIKSSFKIGLTPFEYFLSTHGARKGLSDTATKTAESGYLTRRLVDAVQDITITDEDCGTNKGFKIKAIVDTKENSIIEALYDRIVGRYASEDIIKDGRKYLAKDQLITAKIAKMLVDNKIEEISIRSVLTCNSHRGICKKCYGLDLSTQKEVNIGEAIGIIAAQSIGEPGTQLTMRTFHTGGVAGVSDITRGFSRLMELVDANKNPKSMAIISKTYGVVDSITPYAYNKENRPIQFRVVIKHKIGNEEEEVEYIIDTTQKSRFRIKKGDFVEPGSKITEGSIQLNQLLEFGGTRTVQSYLIKEIQKLYRIQGIEISDKYIEVIIKQMLSKVIIIDSGDSKLYISQIISDNQLKEINAELFAKNKKPAFGKQIIIGVKPLPLKSESFLSAASYQRTAEALVNASISKQIDNLYGIKESLIVGKKIPVGTGILNPDGKYKIFDDADQDLREMNFRRYQKQETKLDIDSIFDELNLEELDPLN
ncbi:DNA-directed RNA polymerase subunit beta' [Candidatus Hepatoplasma crinochetorum Av]|uniref:DNA-directed RNA polymerase subunit beta' n=1 Tax=Candidatus Hepatoplasma crinochetorum Av TaxID=1427984 RepID=W8GNJ7_9MOLU|nr:DNA-directed RNA polymerase subunit beta' [Candidatus Hepatoplasma crinochetorum]AHK22601.1 DNA-directed RNA polymerase subunit beta' [Candidatus Hepatoplasma crinochetorum Av]